MNIIERFLTINPFSRWGRQRKATKAIVIHWLENPMQSASKCADFFEYRKNGNSGYGSAHYIVDLNGDVLYIVPENEVAFHCGSSQTDPASGKIYTDLARSKFGQYAIDYKNLSPNSVTLGIECCHVDISGKMNQATYDSLVELTATLCKKYKLDPVEDVLLHKGIVGWKQCHKWFVNNPTEWEVFKNKVKEKTLSM